MNERSASSETRPGAGWTVRLAAVCEFVGAFAASILILRVVTSALGMTPWKTAQAELLAGGDVDFFRLAKLAAADQLIRYGALLGLGFAIGWWRRRRPLAAWGVTRARRGWGELFRIGIVLWAVSKVLPAGLVAADDHLPWIGRGPDHWALFPSTWSAGFVLYMAAGSFLLVPVVEELAFRGYLLGRLREDFGDAGALLLSTVFFTLAHAQYFKAEVLSLGMLASLAIAALAAGWVVVRTGSLVPCVVAHALANFPPPPWEWSEEAQLALVVTVAALAWRPLASWGGDLLALANSQRHWRGTLFGSGVLLGTLGALLALRNQLWALAIALLAISLAIQWPSRAGASGRRR